MTAIGIPWETVQSPSLVQIVREIGKREDISQHITALDKESQSHFDGLEYYRVEMPRYFLPLKRMGLRWPISQHLAFEDQINLMMYDTLKEYTDDVGMQHYFDDNGFRPKDNAVYFVGVDNDQIASVGRVVRSDAQSLTEAGLDPKLSKSYDVWEASGNIVAGPYRGRHLGTINVRLREQYVEEQGGEILYTVARPLTSRIYGNLGFTDLQPLERTSNGKNRTLKVWGKLLQPAYENRGWAPQVDVHDFTASMLFPYLSNISLPEHPATTQFWTPSGVRSEATPYSTRRSLRD